MAFEEQFRAKVILGIEDSDDKKKLLKEVADREHFECDKHQSVKYVNMNILFCGDTKENTKRLKKFIYYLVYVYDNGWVNAYKVDKKKRELYIFREILDVSFKIYEVVIFKYDTEEDLDVILSSIFEGEPSSEIQKSYFELLDAYTGIKKKMMIMFFFLLFGGLFFGYMLIPNKEKKVYKYITIQKEPKLTKEQELILKFAGSQFFIDNINTVAREYSIYVDKVRIGSLNVKLYKYKTDVNASIDYSLEFNYPASDTILKGDNIWVRKLSFNRKFTLLDYPKYKSKANRSLVCLDYALKGINPLYINVSKRQQSIVEIQTVKLIKPSLALKYLTRLRSMNCFIVFKDLSVKAGGFKFDYLIYY